MNVLIYCLEANRGGMGEKVGYLPSGSNEVKACGQWSRFLVDCFD